MAIPRSAIQRARRACVVTSILAWLAPVPGPARALSFGQESPATANMIVTRDTLAVFLVPSMQNAQDPSATRTRALVRAALTRVKQCLGRNNVDYALVFAKQVVVNSAGRIDTFNVGDPAPSIAALLARPGSNTRVIYVTGPESLERTLPLAVQEYFQKRC